jgi:hypothetical protein
MPLSSKRLRTMNEVSHPLSLVNPSWNVPDFISGSRNSRSFSSIAVRLSQVLPCQLYDNRVKKSPASGRNLGSVYSTEAQYFSFGETGSGEPLGM